MAIFVLELPLKVSAGFATLGVNPNYPSITFPSRLYNQGVASVDIQQIFKQASSKTTKPNPKVRNVAQVSQPTPKPTHVHQFSF